MKSIFTMAIILFSSFANAAFDHTNKTWAEVLKKYVVDKGAYSQVNYKGIIADQKGLKAYVKELGEVKRSDYDKWTENQKLAFLINAYNAFTVELIVDNREERGIRKIFGWFGDPWEKEAFTLFGKKVDLNWIEHRTIRVDFKEPRIHFAVNCASIGCPKLRAEPFIAEKLDAQLEEQTKLFMSDKSRNEVNLKKKELQVTKLFDWYGDDFVKSDGSREAFIAKYITDDPALQKQIKDKKFDLEFKDYDWSLNKVK